VTGAADWLERLNPVQRAAVEHGEGPLLLLAGAGSGKTRVVTCRIARLLRDGVRPEQIVAVTFTNKAAAEMRERVSGLLGESGAEAVAGRLTISTFHALGARFLRRNAEAVGRRRDFTIYDDDDQLAVIKRALTALGVPTRLVDPRQIRSALDRAKNEGRALRAEDLPPEAVAAGALTVGDAYEQQMLAANAFDFGDLILRPAEILERDEGLRGLYRRWWAWLLVDEFQDTNIAQYRWLNAVAPPGANLFVVGDDDQSIYGWRGAEVSNILEFEDRYPGATVLRLTQNYRSTGHILDAANRVIAHNARRLGKDLWTDQGPGLKVEVADFAGPREEADFAAGEIASLLRGGEVAAGDVAIFFRTNALSLDVEEALRRRGLPYVVVRGRSFYDRAEVKDVLAYARLLVNPDDDVAFRRAAGVPARGVGKTSLDRLSMAAESGGTSIDRSLAGALAGGTIKGKAKGGLRAFADALATARGGDGHAPAGQAEQTQLAGLADGTGRAERAGLADRLEEIGKGPGSAALRELLTEVGYFEHLERSGGTVEEVAQRQANVDRLLVAVEAHEETGPEADLASFLEAARLVSEVDVAELDGGAISMMTVHAAKGLEFPVVFVVGLEEGVFPHARSLTGNDEDVEEERRLFYVAATRARRRLYLSYARVRRTFGQTRANPPSRFLAELPRDALAARFVPDEPLASYRRRPAAGSRAAPPRRGPEPTFVPDDGDAPLRVGMRVWHAQFGAGEVKGVRRGMRPLLTVDFPDIGERKIDARFLSPYDG
jgi:DNA helicase-2/ATP-dependent DNA helicase PcrA